MLRSLILLSLLCCLPLATIFAQNCPPPVVAQEVYVFPYEAQYTFTLTGATGGLAELVKQGQPFDSAVAMAIFDNKVYFQFLMPNTTYNWRARAYCNSGGLSDWTAVFTFTTPPPCPTATVMPFDTTITLTFPASPDPNIGYYNCGLTHGAGYVFTFVAPFNSDYVLSVVDASGGNVQTGVSYLEEDYCRGATNCLSVTSEAGLNAYLPVINAGNHLTFVFSAAQGVTATRRIRLHYGTCYPPQLVVDTLKPTFARVYGTTAHVDLELIAETDTFTGVPDYTNVSGLVTFQNLMPGTSYRWRGRTNCGGDFSAWVNGPGFSTPYDCDSIPLLKCDSVYGGFAAGVGRQKMLRYRPARSHQLVFIYNIPANPINLTMTVAVRDSALAACFDPNWQVAAWPTYFCCRSGADTLLLGYVEAGKTYYLYANKADDTTTLAGTLRWLCPSACPAPGNLHSTVVAANAATLYWQNNGATTNWEIEVQPGGASFTGTPQYSGSGNSFTVTQLLLDTLYNWRVRSICAGEGTGEWSGIHNFHTPMDCANAVEVTCALAVGAVNFPSFSQLNNCPGASEGTERFFRFTPPYSGEYFLQSFQSQYVGFSFKALTGDCAVNTGWTCLGQGSNTWPMGQLTGGQTYLIALDFPSYADFPDLQAYFGIVCPISCLAPTDLFNSNLAATSVQLNWTAQPNQVSWEIEIQPIGTAFTNVANYFSNQNNLLVSNLLATTAYHWRVRGNCGAFGQSNWSETKNFLTLPDCNAYTPLACEDEVTLYFPEGEGYWTDLPDCSQHITGRERIVQFTATAMTQYVFLPGLGAYSGFYLKNAASGPCAETAGWQCVGNSDSVLITLPNLTPGATYYLLCKRREIYGTDSVRLSLHCTPCVAPRDPETEILYNGTWLKAKWDGGNGPWTYQVALRYPDGSEQTHSGAVWNYDGHNLLDWFTVNTSDIYAWRVRSICNNGDTSAWTPYSRFRLPLCAGSEILPCHDTLVSSVGAPDQYFYYNVCNGKTEFGQQRIFRLVAQPGGDFQLRLDLNNNSTVHYALSGNVGSSCGAAEWPNCGTFTGDTLLQLNNLGYGNYLLQFFTLSSVPLAPTIETFCPCIAPQEGKGFLYSNGQAVLNWTETYTATQVAIEVVPVGTSFSGVPNYYADTNSVLINGLDPNLTYQFRVRNRCGATQYSGWSPVFSINLLIDCANMPTLACGAILSLEVSPNLGSFNFQPCGSVTFGDETFFKIIPEFNSTYVLEIIGTPHTSSIIHLGFLDNCDSPTSTITCIGSGGAGEYQLGYLEAGQSYYIVADQSSLIGGTYQMRLNCQLGNDNPTIFLGNPNPAYFITVGDSCRVFSNQNATANNDPDPSQPPGNWYDATEHSVWFAFVAPPGGTVQITAASTASQPFDPQVALMVFDTLSGGSFSPFALLATGEDNVGPNPADAVLIYTGLIPGQTYYILVDGVNGSSGRFCLTIRDEPDVWLTTGVCETFDQPAAIFETTGAWRNLYTNAGPNVTGTLLGAIRTVDDLGNISISTEILPETPILPDGQKILPRYFNFETEFAPQNPVTLRLFFTAADLATFNLAPPTSATTPIQLGLTHYDGDQEDCDPSNNALTGGLAVNAAQATLVGENGLFYLEAVFDNFSEFGAALKPTVGTSAVPMEQFLVSAFPNPFDNVLQLQLHSPVATSLDLQLFDVLANAVYREKIGVQAGENVAKLDLPGLIPGVYQLVLYRAGAVVGRIRVVKM